MRGASFLMLCMWFFFTSKGDQWTWVATKWQLVNISLNMLTLGRATLAIDRSLQFHYLAFYQLAWLQRYRRPDLIKCTWCHINNHVSLDTRPSLTFLLATLKAKSHPGPAIEPAHYYSTQQTIPLHAIIQTETLYSGLSLKWTPGDRFKLSY